MSLDYSFRVTSQLARVADVQFCFSFVGRAVEHVEDQINDAQVLIYVSLSWMDLNFVCRSWRLGAPVLIK